MDEKLYPIGTFVLMIISLILVFSIILIPFHAENKYRQWKEGSILEQFEFCRITKEQSNLILTYVNQDYNFTKWVKEMNDSLLEERRKELSELYNITKGEFNYSFRNDKKWRDTYARVKGLKR